MTTAMFIEMLAGLKKQRHSKSELSFKHWIPPVET
jgi:hypothetical protein